MRPEVEQLANVRSIEAGYVGNFIRVDDNQKVEWIVRVYYEGISEPVLHDYTGSAAKLKEEIRRVFGDVSVKIFSYRL